MNGGAIANLGIHFRCALGLLQTLAQQLYEWLRRCQGGRNHHANPAEPIEFTPPERVQCCVVIDRESAVLPLAGVDHRVTAYR